MGDWKWFRQKLQATTIVALAVALAVVGCGYDYTALEGHRRDGGLTGTGGVTDIYAEAGSSGAGASMNGTGGSVATGGKGAIGGAGHAGSGAGGSSATGKAGDGGGGNDKGNGSGEAGHGSGGIAGAGQGGIGGAGGGGGAAGSGGGRGGQAGSSPSVLSIDFVGGRWATGGAGGLMLIGAATMGPSEVAGVKPVAWWNSAPGPAGSLSALVSSSGAVTTATVSWTSPPSPSGPGVWTKGFVDAPGDVRMMNGYLDPLSASTPATVVVTGLPDSIAAGGYDVYVYTTGDIRSANTRTCTYTIGSTSITETEVGPTATTFAGFTQASTGGQGNYLLFKKVTGTSFTLTAKPGSTGLVRAPVNGMQIVWPSGA